jgi:eukaryotic-like serine/threonine-protein kinase
MTLNPDEGTLLRFGIYELDPRSGELRRDGVAVRLPPQPFRVLWMLASRPGVVVTREEIRQELWGNDTFVDFDGGLNFCINQIRRALRDSAESPRFVHTLPRRGYRFLASVENVAAPPVSEPTARIDPDTPWPGTAPPRYALLNGGALRSRSSEALNVEELPTPARPAPALPQARTDALLPDLPPLEGPLTEPLSNARPLAAAPRRRRAWLLLVITLLGAVAAAVVLFVPWKAPLPPRFQRITFRRGTVQDARFAPGGQVVYTASWDGGSPALYSVRPEAPESRSLGDGRIAAVARSGELAVLIPGHKQPSVLARMPAAGGPPREIREMVMSADWTPGADLLALVRRDKGQEVLEFPAGRELYRTVSKLTHLRVAPDNQRLAFLEHPVNEDDRGSLVMIDGEGRRTELSPGWASAEGVAWHPGTREIWFTAARVGADAALHAVTTAGRVREVARVPGRLVLHDVAEDGRVLLQRNILRMELLVGGAAAAGGQENTPRERELSWLDFSAVSDISPDGRQVVFGESGEGGGARYSVYLRYTDGTPPVRLGDGRPFTLSPDRRWVVSEPLGNPARLVLLPTGSGEPRELPGTGLTGYIHAAWFPDSQRLLITARVASGENQVFVQDITGGPPQRVSGPGYAGARVVSPDGQRILLARPDRKPPYSLFTIDGGAEEPVPALTGEDRPLAWSADGRSVIVRGRATPVAVDRVDLATGTRERLYAIAPADGAGAGHVGWLAVTPDGQHYAYSFHRTLSDLYVVEGLR